MAIVWSKHKDNYKYEIRTAGSSVRLYTNGVFHSQYNQKRKFCSGIWDLLVLPLFTIDITQIKRVLVLGVGGGAAIKMIQDHFSPDEIVGVELNAVHLYVAKRFFKINTSGVSFYEADAYDWLNSYQGEKFDLIIDDVFTEVDGQPERAIEFNSSWHKLITKHLSNKGILISNFVSGQEFVESAIFKNKSQICKRNTITAFSDRRYENQIIVVCSRSLSDGNKHIGPGVFVVGSTLQIKECIPDVIYSSLSYLICRRICK